MTQNLNGFKCLLICAVLVLGGSDLQVQARKGRRHSSRTRAVKEWPSAEEESKPAFEGVRLKLADGSFMKVDDAWESEQGIWYRQGGITHLASSDKVKSIERAEARKPELEPIVAVVKESTPTPINLEDRPAWIYLKGGARVEADAAAESAAGVWYRRGSMSIFIERLRLDHIEREDLESLANSASSAGKERGWSTGNQHIDGLIRQNGTKFGVDPYLIFCVMEQESHFNSRAVSPKGARGLMQLMPGTGARFGVRRPHDPAQNIAGGTRYLKQLLTQFGGRVDLVLASYNAGEGAVLRYGRVPPYRETRDYVKRISYRYKRAKQPVSPPANTATAGGF